MPSMNKPNLGWILIGLICLCLFLIVVVLNGDNPPPPQPEQYETEEPPTEEPWDEPTAEPESEKTEEQDESVQGEPVVESVSDNNECSGALGPSFEIGDRFVVPFGDGPSGVFKKPNSVPKLGKIPEGSGGIILDGPVCVTGQEGNLYSWLVRTDSDLEGWMSEGYDHSEVPWIIPE